VILFCDTSALIKLIMKEAGSDQVSSAANGAESLAMCTTAWAEAMAALAQRESHQFCGKP
jgi:uncharacterized protein with PIN domain